MSRVISAMEVELLVVLYRLRYLSLGQIGGWYRGRSPGPIAKRVSRLTKSQVLKRVPLPHSRHAAAWRLGTEGVRQLRALRGSSFVPERRRLSSLLLPHHLDTNDVWLALARGELVWGRLPFEWLAGGRHACSYEARRRDDFGVLRKRKARLIADAIILAKRQGAARIFLELDRGTECLREANARRSIRGKLVAYQGFLCGADGRWYRAAFPDGRKARVLFVLHCEDARHERLKAIEAAARDIAPQVSVQCLYLHQREEIVQACGLEGGSAAARGKGGIAQAPSPKPRPCLVTRDEFLVLNRLHQQVCRLSPRVDESSLREAANSARTVLVRMRESF